MQRIAIVGAGAMGTLLGHGLLRAGYEVTLLDLPPRIDQIQSSGSLIVVAPDGTETAASPSSATSDYSAAGVHDVVILATKSQDLPAAAKGISNLIDDSSVVVTIQNGIPWWYLQDLDCNLQRSQIDCLDPAGQLHRAIDPSQIIGCVAYPAAMMDQDGRAHHIEGYRFPIGELDGTEKDRTRLLAKLFEGAGFKSRIIDDIRSEIWLKAWGAISINPISALTRATMADICTFPQTHALVEQMMQEIQKVAEALGASFRHTIEKRIAGAAAVGAHKTSMLQDVENGRALELDGLMLATIELAERVDIAVPTVRSIYACTALLDQQLRTVASIPAAPKT